MADHQDQDQDQEDEGITVLDKVVGALFTIQLVTALVRNADTVLPMLRAIQDHQIEFKPDEPPAV